MKDMMESDASRGEDGEYASNGEGAGPREAVAQRVILVTDAERCTDMRVNAKRLCEEYE